MINIRYAAQVTISGTMEDKQIGNLPFELFKTAFLSEITNELKKLIIDYVADDNISVEVLPLYADVYKTEG